MHDAVTRKAAPEIQILLLGHGSIFIAGAPAKLPKRATTLAMLAMVALGRGRPVARDALAFALFPDVNEAVAARELRRYLWRVARALPARADRPLLIVDSETIRWNLAGPAFVDALEFERLAAETAMRATAVDLYAGDLLEDVYDDWIVPERERLRAIYLQALYDLVATNRSTRNNVAALGYARRFLATEPWREDMVRQAMAIHYALGDSSGARAEYHEFAERLRAEMGIEPMPETVALREAILRGDALIGSVDAGASLRADSRQLRVLPFIGRERERAAMRVRWDAAAGGDGGVVLVSGEAGVGKTRLVGELAQLAEAQGARVYGGSTSSPESSPYQSIVEALRAALPVMTARPMDPMMLGVLSGILPELRAQAEPLEVAELSPDRESARLYASLATAVQRLASPRPLLLVLEDLHWASRATIEALSAIARRIDRARVLIVATYREEETPASHPVRALADALGTERRTTELHLARFSRDDVAQLVTQLDDLNAAGPSEADRLYAFSEGNALFLNEAIAYTLESAGEALAGADSTLGGIANVIAARTALLSKTARIVAEIAAICGQGCNVDVVRDVAGLSAAQTREAFNELLDRRFMREAGAREWFDFVFTHHLIGTSTYEQIDAEVRARRHARIAYVLEGRAAQRIGVVRDLARHYDLGGLSEQAARWYGHAAREAAAVYANDDAAALATLAIDRQSDPTLLIEALFVREEANARLGHREARAADLDRLDQLVETAELRCRILSRQILLLHSSEERSAERQAIDALRERALASGDRSWQGRAECADARFLLATAQYAAAKVAARNALAHFEAAGGVRDRIDALLALNSAHEATGERAEADRLLEQARSIASSAGERPAVAETLMHVVTTASERWQMDRAASVAEAALEEYRAIGDRLGEASALARSVHPALCLLRWAPARTANLAAAQIFEMVGDQLGLALVLWNMGVLYFRGGDLTRARTFMVDAREHYERVGHRYGRAACFLNEGLLAVWQGRARDAKSLAQAALDGALEIDRAQLRALALANLGHAERELGELDAALSHMHEGLALERELGRPPLLGNVADAALAYVMHGELGVAVPLAEHILNSDRALSSRSMFPPYPPWIAACVFHWDGNEERAQQSLESASELARSIATSIDVPELREHFEALPFFAEIAEAKDAGRWPSLPL